VSSFAGVSLSSDYGTSSPSAWLESAPQATNPFPWMSEVLDLKKEKNFSEARVTEYQSEETLQW